MGRPAVNPWSLASLSSKTLPGALRGWSITVDVSSLYLRVFLGAKSFESPELDQLAGRMDALRLLDGDNQERYFRTKASVAAMSLGNKMLFGARYYDRLDESQRLAVGAHEFAHMLTGDHYHVGRRVSIPSLAATLLLTLGALLATGSMLLAEFVLVAGFLSIFYILSRRDAQLSQEEERRCDRMALSFVDGLDLIAAIEMGGRLGGRRSERSPPQAAGVRSSPNLEERIEMIGKALAGRASQPP